MGQPRIFVLAAGLTFSFFVAVSIFSMFLRVFVPKSLIDAVGVLVSLGLFVVLLVVARRKRLHWLTAASLGC